MNTQKKPTILEDLALVSVKHRVYIVELFAALVLARENGESCCRNLTIQYRGVAGKDVIFLITEFNKIIMQFRISEELLCRKGIRFESLLDNDRIRKQIFRQDYLPHACTMVQDLRYGMKRVSVEGEVLEPPKSSLIRTRCGGSALVTNVWIGDETGKVRFCLWNDQAQSLVQGDIIRIRNASVSMYGGERQLILGRSGTVNLTTIQSSGTKALAIT